jgi:hypothetical protein
MSGAKRLLLFAGGTRDSGSAPTIPAPVLAWDDEASDASPDFAIQIDPSSQVGDVFTVQISATSDFAIVLQELTDTLDIGELGALTVNIEMADLSSGTYYARAKQSRGETTSQWSNTETVTLVIPGLAAMFLLLEAA